MAMMDPAMRERLKQRLAAAGINTDVMATSGKDADALLKLMRERGQGLAAKLGFQQSAKPPGGAQSAYDASQDRKEAHSLNSARSKSSSKLTVRA